MNEEKLSEEEVSGEEKIKRDLIGKVVAIETLDDDFDDSYLKVIAYDDKVVEIITLDRNLVFIPWTRVKRIVLYL